MSTLFISHSSRDAEAAAELADWLRRHGHHSLFLDFDVELGIPAGRDWERELYRRLRACQALIVLCSEASMASCWCLAEISHARALGKQILPVRIAPCTLRPQLRELQVIDLVREPEAGFDRLRRALSGVFAWDTRRPPYPGLMAFEEADAAIFFGRDAEIQRALDRLNRLRRFGGPRLLLLLGASGSGKSSLMRAGLLPRLRAAPEAWTPIGPVRPGERPRDALVERLRAGLEAESATDTLSTMAGDAAAQPGLLPAALEALRARPGRERSALVLVIDQLEELLKDGEQVAPFQRILRPVLQATDGAVLVIATLRSDFLGALQAQPGWRDIPLAPLTVAPLSVEGFSAVIEGPAELAGLDLEAGLVPAMVADTATEDALPLLAFTLRELWERGRADGRLTLAEYRELGGLHGAVAKAAEAVLDAARPTPAQRHALRQALFALVRLDDEGRYTRRVVRWRELPVESRPLLERFIQARLLIAGRHAGERTLEVAHESLFRVWRRLHRWLEANREALRIHEGLRRAAEEWQRGGHSDELLVHRGGRLEEAEALARKATLPLEEPEQRYLGACRALRDAELAERRRRERLKRRWVAATWLTLLGGLIGLAGFAWSLQQQERATRQGLAELHWANAVSARDRDGDPLRASHHFMQAAALAPAPPRAASAYWAAAWLGRGPVLEAVVDAGPGLLTAAFEASGGVRLWSRGGGSLAWSEGEGRTPPALPAGQGAVQLVDSTGTRPPWQRRLAVAGEAGRVEVRDRHSGALLLETPPALEGLWIGGAGEAVAVTRHAGGEAWVWDLDRGVRRGPLPGVTPEGVAFAPDGERLLVWTADGTAWLHRDGETVRLEGTGPGSARRIVGGALGRGVGELALWDAVGRLWLPEREGQALAPSGEGRCSPRATGARFLAAPARLLVWNHGACGTARLWAFEPLAPLGPVMRHDDEIAPPRVSGERILTWSPGGGPARLWHAATGAPLATLPGPVADARFAAPPGPLITWGGPEARLWSPRDGTPLGLPLRHAAPIAGVEAGAAGERLLSWSTEGNLRRWRGPATGAVEAAGWRFEAAVLDAVPLPGEARVLAVTLDGRLRAWPPVGDAVPPWLDLRAVFAAFSPDGRRLLTATAEGEVRIWNREGESFRELAAPGGTAGDDPLAGVTWGGADRLLFWGTRGCTAWLWRLGTARVMPVAHGQAADPDCRLRGAAFAGDGGGQALTWGEDRRLRRWDTEAPLPEALDTPLEDTLVRDARLVAEGVLVAAADGRILLIGPTETLEFEHAGVRGVRLHAGTRRLLGWGGEEVRLWDARDGALLAALSHDAAVAGAAFTPDGERLLSWRRDGAVRLWDALTGQPLTPALGGTGPVPPAVDVEASAAMLRLLVIAGDRARLWRFPPFAAPPSEPVRHHEVLTGSRLTPQGEVVALPGETWRALRDPGD